MNGNRYPILYTISLIVNLDKRNWILSKLNNFFILSLRSCSIAKYINVNEIFVPDEEGLYKPVPPPKPVPNNQKIQNGQQDSRIQTVAEQSSRTIVSGVERNTTLDESQLRSSGQNVAPEYRMPPLYGEEQSSSQTQQPANLQTHSSKFPVSVFEYIYTHETWGVSNFLGETVITKLYIEINIPLLN